MAVTEVACEPFPELTVNSIWEQLTVGLHV